MKTKEKLRSETGFQIYIWLRRHSTIRNTVEICLNTVYGSTRQPGVVCQDRSILTRSWNNRDSGALYALTHVLEKLAPESSVVVYSNSKKLEEVLGYGGAKDIPIDDEDRAYVLDLLKSLKDKKVRHISSPNASSFGKYGPVA